MTAIASITGTGPCGSTIVSGTPTINCTSGKSQITVTFKVPSDQLCCFAEAIFGGWICTDRELCYKFAPVRFPCLCLTGDKFFEPVGIKVTTPSSGSVNPVQYAPTVWPVEIQTWMRGETDWITRCANSLCLLDVVVTFELPQRRLSDEYEILATEVCVGSTGGLVLPPQVPWPLSIEASKRAGVEGKTVQGDELKFCPPLNPADAIDCSCVVSQDTKFFAPINTDFIDIKVSNNPCPNWAELKRCRGAVNTEGFLGYPARAVLYNGYTVEETADCLCRETFNIVFHFIAKFVPANGETNEYTRVSPGDENIFIESHECVLDSVGWWGRSWCDKPLPGTTQNWLFVCNQMTSTGDPPVVSYSPFFPGKTTAEFLKLFVPVFADPIAC